MVYLAFLRIWVEFQFTVFYFSRRILLKPNLAGNSKLRFLFSRITGILRNSQGENQNVNERRGEEGEEEREGRRDDMSIDVPLILTFFF